MSWFFKSLQSNEDPESSDLKSADSHSSSPERSPFGDSQGDPGIKDDVSGLLRGVANFLAPPPSSSAGDSADSTSKTLDGIRNDLVEIGGTFKSKLSLLSSNKVVTGISELASQLLHFEGPIAEDDREGDGGGYDSDDGFVPGTTDEVVRFVREIAMRPECWTEFPSPLDHGISNLFRLWVSLFFSIQYI